RSGRAAADSVARAGLLRRFPAGGGDRGILAGPAQPAARPAALPPGRAPLASGTPVTLTPRLPSRCRRWRIPSGGRRFPVTAGLIDTTEMYLRTLFELEEEGIPPLRARIAERLSQ